MTRNTMLPMEPKMVPTQTLPSVVDVLEVSRSGPTGHRPTGSARVGSKSARWIRPRSISLKPFTIT